MGFIRKVYGILSAQLLLTTASITAVKAIEGGDEYMQTPAMSGIAIGALLLSIVIEIAIVCCKSVARSSPMNYILLFLFTAFQSLAFAYICSFYPG